MTPFLKDLVLALLSLIVAALGLLKVRELRLTKKYNLKGNPTRCGEMIARVEALEDDVKEIKRINREDHQQLFAQVGGVSLELARICGRLNGAGK
jgi:hypothetical protein